MANKFEEFVVDYVEDKKALLIDINNLAHRTLHVAAYNEPDDFEFFYWKYLMTNSIFAMLKNFNPNRVICCIDSKNSWRKKIYSEYKGDRKDKRDQSKIDYAKFFTVLDEFMTSFKDTFTNFYCLKVEGLEADDLISIFSKNFIPEYKKTIISMDTDMIQLLQNKGVRIWHPLNKKYVESLNPKLELEVKILTGDKTDNIPPVKAKVGEKTALKLIKSGLDILLINEEYKQNYQRNRQLIDLDYTPTELINTVQVEFEQYNIQKVNQLKILDWLMRNRMQKFAEDLSQYTRFIENVK
jgi:5'-3' exonuclease